MLALARTGSHRRRSHHGDRLQEQRDVRPEWFGCGAVGKDFVIQPRSKVAANHHGTGGQQNPEPAGTPLVTCRSPDHHRGSHSPQSCAGNVGEGGQSKTRPAHQRHNGVQEQKAEHYRQLPTGQRLHVSSVSDEHERNWCSLSICFTWPGIPCSARKEDYPQATIPPAHLFCRIFGMGVTNVEIA